ncbi:2696_t:CDS:2, partial [Dentiscutata erythropus]
MNQFAQQSFARYPQTFHNAERKQASNVNAITFFNAPFNSPDVQVSTGPRYNNVLPPPNPASNSNIHPPHLPPLNLPKKLENQPPSLTSSTSPSPEPTNHCHQTQSSENDEEDNETKRVKTLEEKRAIRLERNRIAAKECRERKKAYVLNLERRATQMEKENSVLRKKVHELKAQLEWAESKTVGPVENGQLEALVRELKERVKKMEKGEDSNIVFGKMVSQFGSGATSQRADAFLKSRHNKHVKRCTITHISIVYSRIPGSGILLKYIKNSHQNDPFRTFLEVLLVLFGIIYLLTNKYRTDNKLIDLTPSEIEELVEEWQPEPLVPTITENQRIELEKTPILNGPQGPRVKLVNCKNSSLINLASFDFLGLTKNELIKEKAIQVLRKYGVGSCGPPGFYGTIDVHTEFERTVSEFLGTDDTILYSQAFSTIGSAIPSFCKRGDIIVADQGCNFAIQKGIQISRSVIKWYKHNDMQDLENILLKIKNEDIESGRRLTRRFIVTEGIFENSGDIALLPKL